jgi:hypothetical protein
LVCSGYELELVLLKPYVSLFYDRNTLCVEKILCLTGCLAENTIEEAVVKKLKTRWFIICKLSLRPFIVKQITIKRSGGGG